MSGHSKWHNIQGRKNAQDAKRGKIFPLPAYLNEIWLNQFSNGFWARCCSKNGTDVCLVQGIDELINKTSTSAKATAAFVGDDELACGVLNGAKDAGVKVPAEFEIITSNK